MKNYRPKENYPRVGNSKYFYNVWYKVNNPHAKYIPKEGDEALQNPFSNMTNFVRAAASALQGPAKDKKMLGYFARQPFNSIKLFFEGHTSGNIWATEKEKKEIKWECRMFLDTLECGSECIAAGTAEEVHKKVAEMLDAAQVTLDIDNTQEDIKSYIKEVEDATKHIDFLHTLLITENPNHEENTKRFHRKKSTNI